MWSKTFNIIFFGLSFIIIPFSLASGQEIERFYTGNEDIYARYILETHYGKPIKGKSGSGLTYYLSNEALVKQYEADLAGLLPDARLTYIPEDFINTEVNDKDVSVVKERDCVLTIFNSRNARYQYTQNVCECVALMIHKKDQTPACLLYHVSPQIFTDDYRSENSMSRGKIELLSQLRRERLIKEVLSQAELRNVDFRKVESRVVLVTSYLSNNLLELVRVLKELDLHPECVYYSPVVHVDIACPKFSSGYKRICALSFNPKQVGDYDEVAQKHFLVDEDQKPIGYIARGRSLLVDISSGEFAVKDN